VAVTRASIYAEIDAERARQHELWDREHDWGYGDCSSAQVSAAVKAAVLAEECGEVARAALDGSADLRTELLQVAAVAVAWIESLPALNEKEA
jgi:NTP pyrophosphatase (non-canonical NTP hydrolase)